MAQDQADQADQRPKSSLLTWDQISSWQRDNEYILSAYRKASGSYSTSLKTVLQIHNETANIWSHLLATLAFLILLWRSNSFVLDSTIWHSSDDFVVALYYISVAACFFLSAVYHTFSDHSPDLHRFGNELDHLGIVFVMWGSGISTNHFTFHEKHDLTLRNTYHLIITTTAVGCALFTLRPRFRLPRFRPFRVLLYTLQGLGLFLPCIHSLYLYGWAATKRNTDLGSFFSLACIQLSGGAIYGARIPERWVPYKFDIIGQSHNWLHVFVVVGALVRMRGLQRAKQFWNPPSFTEDSAL